MKNTIAILVFFFSVGIGYCGQVAYNKTTGEIGNRVRGGGTMPYDVETQNILIVNDEHPVFNTDKRFMVCVLATKEIVARSESEINDIKKEAIKLAIRKEIRLLKQQYLEAMEERSVSDSFDVSVETTAIRAKIVVLKQEYDGL